MSTAAPSPPSPAVAPPVEDCGPRLRELFPALFSNPPKPIKLRIQADIQARSPGVFTKPQLSAFLRRYTGSFAYLNALVKASHRFDLDGNAGDEVSAEHRQAAIDELARRRANHQARVELEAQQRANRATLLNDFQATTLTPANFAALKGIPAEELEPLLERARHEAAEAPPPPARERGHRGPPGRPAPKPRPDGGAAPRVAASDPVGPADARPRQDDRPVGARPGAPERPPRGRPQAGDRPPRGPRPEIGNRKARPESRPGGGAGAPAPRRDQRVEVVSLSTQPPTAMAAALAAARAAAASKSSPPAPAASREEASAPSGSEERESGSS